MLQKYQRFGLMAFASVLGLFAIPAMAQSSGGTDFSPVTSAINWSSVATGLVAVAAAVVVLYIAWKGARMLAHAVKGF